MHQSDETESGLQPVISRYLSDIIHSYKSLSARYTPLYTDLLSGVEYSVESPFRRGMGIVEAERALHRFIVVGEPGAGKTTALTYLALMHSLHLTQSPELLSHILYQPAPYRIPVIVELNLYRPVEQENGIRRMIFEQLYPYSFSEEFNRDIERMLESGALVVILDGLNECPLAYRERAVSDIKHFLLWYPRAGCIISCRARDFPDVFQLSVLNITPLTDSQIDAFIRRSLIEVDNTEKRCAELKEVLFSRHTELIRNPLLLTITVDVYRKSNWRIPDNRGVLFKQFFEIWFQRESLKQQKTITPGRMVVFFELVGAIAYYMQNRGEIRTSREAVWGVIRTALEQYIDKGIIQKESYSADSVLDMLFGMGFLIETGGRVKFYHQLFQEFFAGYNLLQEQREESLKRLEYTWWEEPLKFYAGLTEDTAPLIHEAMRKTSVFTAAELLMASSSYDTAVCADVYRRLISLLVDKFAYNREKAKNLLIKLPDKTVEAFLEKVSGDDTAAAEILSIRAGKKQTYRILCTPDEHRIEEPLVSYGGSVAHILQRLESDTEKNRESAAAALLDIARTIGYEALERDIYTLLKTLQPPERVLFLVWCLSVVKSVDSLRCLLDVLHKGGNRELFIAVPGMSEKIPEEVKIMCAIALHPGMRRVWLDEYVRLERYAEYAVSVINPFSSAVERVLSNNRYSNEQITFLLQMVWDLSSGFAEEMMLKWLEDGISQPYGALIIAFLTRYGLSEKHVNAGRELFSRVPEALKEYFPELLAKAGGKNSLGWLMNCARDEKLLLSVRSAAVAALKWQAGTEEIEFLQELINHPQPEIYDPAYAVLSTIKLRMRYDVKIFAAETADEMAIDYLLELEPPPPAGVVRVAIHKDDPKTAVINGVNVKLGVVSGRIFYYLAKNSSLGRYHTSEEIRTYLERNDFYLDATAVRNRITDIRRTIRRALEGRIDPHRLIENARRFGYRMNAEVEIR